MFAAKKTKDIHTSGFNNRGITLIALVITIVLMLILASITVNVVINGGLFEYAGKAKNDTEIASEKSTITQATIMAMAEDKHGKIVQSELENKVNKMLNDETGKSAEVEENEDNFIVTINSSARKYLVDANGNVRKITWGETTDEDGNNYVTNGDITLQIGDYITYDANDNGEYTYTAEEAKTGVSGDGQTFSSNFETKWRLLGVEHSSDGDYLMIVPETPIQSTSATGFSLYGKLGYRYGIEELENISDVYGHGTGALYAEAMTIEDVNKITGYDPLNTGDGTIFREGTKYEYNSKLTVTRTGYVSNNLVLPNGDEETYTYTSWKYFDENREWTELKVGETISTTNTYYTYFPTTLTDSSTGDIKGIIESCREYSMIFAGGKNYWLASSYDLGGGTSECISYAYGLFNVGLGSVRNCRDNYIIYVGGNANVKTKNVMPIVYLIPNINLRATGNIIDSCTEWKIN